MQIKKTLLTLMLLCGYATANEFASLTSFQAKFKQTITDDANNTIAYFGQVLFKKPNFSKWSYKDPVEKDIFINGKSVTIIDADLEQVIQTTLAKQINLIDILQKAKKKAKDKYKAQFLDTSFDIKTQKGVISSVEYFDELENKVTLSFSKQKSNLNISNSEFLFNIPADYERIDQ